MKKICFLCLSGFLFFQGVQCGEEEAANYLGTFMPKVEARVNVLSGAIQKYITSIESLTQTYNEAKFEETVNDIKTFLNISGDDYETN